MNIKRHADRMCTGIKTEAVLLVDPVISLRKAAAKLLNTLEGIMMSKRT